MLTAIWLRQVSTPSDVAIADLDQLLTLRNLKPKTGEGGRRSGYTPRQRREMYAAIQRIESLWINLSELEVYGCGEKSRKKRKIVAQSRAFVVTFRAGQERPDGHIDVIRFCYRPGEVFNWFLFGPARQTALLSAKAIQYDPYRQKVEKRLTRFFSWQWRIEARSGDYLRPFRVQTLLEAVGLPLSRTRPGRIRDRLENALHKLECDGVIESWQYERSNEFPLTKAGWTQAWLTWTVVIVPPQFIRNAYQNIGQGKGASSPPGTSDLRNRVLHHRAERGASLLTAAEKIGISASLLCRIEKGTRRPSVTSRRKIETWLSQKLPDVVTIMAPSSDNRGAE